MLVLFAQYQGRINNVCVEPDHCTFRLAGSWQCLHGLCGDDLRKAYAELRALSCMNNATISCYWPQAEPCENLREVSGRGLASWVLPYCL